MVLRRKINTVYAFVLFEMINNFLKTVQTYQISYTEGIREYEYVIPKESANHPDRNGHVDASHFLHTTGFNRKFLEHPLTLWTVVYR